MSFDGFQAGFWAQVAIANVVLLVFNLIPAFPMDGGRVLRALLAVWLGYGPATRVAARIGQALAIVLAILGLWGNPMLVLIAAFIFIAAAGEANDVKARELARGCMAADAMITSFQRSARWRRLARRRSWCARPKTKFRLSTAGTPARLCLTPAGRCRRCPCWQPRCTGAGSAVGRCSGSSTRCPPRDSHNTDAAVANACCRCHRCGRAARGLCRSGEHQRTCNARQR